MKVLTATISFKVTDTFSKERMEDEVLDYTTELEDLLDYDCDIDEPVVVDEDEDTLTLAIPVDANLDIIDNDGDVIVTEEDIKREIDEGIAELMSILEDGVEGDVEMVKEEHTITTYSDVYDYNNYVLKDSVLNLLENDIAFESSLNNLFFNGNDFEITAVHATNDGLYFQGIDEDGVHFILAAKYAKEKNEDDVLLLSKHMNEIFPGGNQYFLEIVENGESDEDWEVLSSGGDYYDSYFKSINLRDVNKESDCFYAADTLLCCLDEDYESEFDDDYDL